MKNNLILFILEFQEEDVYLLTHKHHMQKMYKEVLLLQIHSLIY